MRCTAKTHKAVGPGGIPKSRPIVGASKGLTTALGELVSDILEPVARAEPDPKEAQSTEELMSAIKEANLKMKEKEVNECVIGSMDVEALYPSLDQRLSAKIVKEEYIKSDVEIAEVDWKIVALYLAVTASKEELIRDGIYHLTARRRKSVRGRKPTVRNPKVSGPLKKEERRQPDEEGEKDPNEGEDVIRIGERLDNELDDMESDERWIYPREPVTREERKRMFGKVLEILVTTTFANHIYTYKNEASS